MGDSSAKASDDPLAYEEACLKEVRRILAGFEDSLRYGGQEIKNVTVDGVYPDTQLVVTWLDTRRDETVSEPFDLWGMEFHGERGDEPPEGVATLIYAHVSST